MANVLIAIDESVSAEAAFKWYVENLHNPANKVVLLHVLENISIQDMSREAKKDADALKQKYTDLAKTLEVELAEIQIKTSDKPEHSIVDTADKLKATYIVSGSRGMGKIRQTILGSVSYFIVQHAHCPVLICKFE